jgi:tetratricopeptide (TPR) repeat protein
MKRLVEKTWLNVTEKKLSVCNLLAILLIVQTNTFASGKTDAGYQRAQELVKAGHHDQAAKILSEMVRRDPKNITLLLELGEVHLNDMNDMAGAHIQAEKCFKQAIKIDPQSGRAYRMLAEWAIAEGKYDYAIATASQSITAKKPDHRGYFARATAYENQHKEKEALADLDKYLTREHDKKAFKRRAVILEKLHMYARALADYRSIQKDSPDGDAALKEAICLEKLNRNEESITRLDKLLKDSPEDDAALEARGTARAKLGQLQEAAQDYSKAIKLLPTASLYRLRASIYEKMGRKDLAIKDRKEAERI